MAMDFTGSVNNLVPSDYTSEYLIFILKLAGDDTVASRPWEMKIISSLKRFYNILNITMTAYGTYFWRNVEWYKG